MMQSLDIGTITVETTKGQRQVSLLVFPALTGFELNRRYRTDYRTCSNKQVRMEYTLAVLSFAECDGVLLENERAIDGALENWRNVEKVFQAVLKHNEVDLELQEEKAAWFGLAGAELAAAFVAEASSLIVPLMQVSTNQE